MATIKELRDQRAAKLDIMRELVESAEAENRDLTDEEQNKYDAAKSEAESLRARYERMEEQSGLSGALQNRQAAAVLKHGKGDSEGGSMKYFLRTGDNRAFPEEMRDGNELVIRLPNIGVEKRATDTIWNITTAADGGYAVPTGLAPMIAAKKSERMLADLLGVRRIPGVGTTVNFPYESTSLSVFAATSEQADNYANTYERDAVQLGVKAFTLAKKTKKLALTEEVLDDEEANLTNFIADAIGRSLALTHNTALLAEIASNGTNLKTFSSATVIGVNELEAIRYNSTVAFYMDDAASVAWVMQPAVLGEIVSLGSTSIRYYAQPIGLGNARDELLGYPVVYSSLSGATAASAKSVYFGAWDQVGMREDPALRFLRDPYTTDGIVYLKYVTRLVYGILQPEAVGYGVHPSA